MSRAARSSSPPAATPPPAAGRFAVRASRTIAATAADAFGAWTDGRRRARWLAGVRINIRRTAAPSSIRLTCVDDASEIEVRIAPAGRAKCSVVVDHTNLASGQIVAERRHCWKEMLGALKHYLEEPARG